MAKLIYGTPEYEAVKAEILKLFPATPTENFDVKSAIRGRINDLKRTLRETGQKGYVLGISGGVDSSTVGRLAQIACEELRAEGYEAKFYAMRLPAGVQLDEEDAQIALRFIKPDVSLTVNVGEASQLISLQGVAELDKNSINFDHAKIDYHKGNIKSRVRMLAQYQIAGMTRSLVLGTDNLPELVQAFFGKWADAGVDKVILSSEVPGMGVNKRQIRLMAKELGAPESVYVKIPTADLEEEKPLVADHIGMGLTSYDSLDDFLEGKEVIQIDEEVIVNNYNNTRHKRDPIPMYRP